MTFEPPIVANPKRKTGQTEDNGRLSGMAAINKLEQMAGEQATPKSSAEQQREIEERTRQEIDIIAADDYQEQEVNLPAGWRMAEWKQMQLMTIYEAGPLRKALDGEYDNRWRRNYEVVKSVLENGGFDVRGITVDDIGGMNWRDVEQIYLGVVAHYMNTILIKKK